MPLRLNSGRLADALLVLGGLLALSTLFAFLAPAWWAFDLFSHFRVQYAVAALVLAIALLLLRRWRAAWLPIVVAALNLWFVVPLFVATEATDVNAAAPARDHLRVLSVNVFGFNNEYDRVLDYVRRERPDVLVVLEVTPAWAAALSRLAPEYRYQWIHPGDLRSGIALMSRRTPLGVQQIDLGGTGEPSLLLTVPTADGPLSILGTHLYWPLGDRVAAVRNRQLETLGRVSRSHETPLLIAGDLNVTQFSPHFRRLLREGSLRDCAAGRGLQPTWPARVPFLFIRIDHCVATQGVRVQDVRVGDYVGSDHYPIVIDVAVIQAARVDATPGRR
jgi:endonuclease/exonuclease/phosphatase (EEP) superfamily protein YafD